MNSTLTKYAPWMLGLLRIVTALVYLEHGTQKLFHFPPMAARAGGAETARAAARAAKAAADAAVSAVSSVADTAMSAVSSMASSVDPSAVPAPPAQGLQTVTLIGGLIEVIGGLALLLGLFTRPVAFIVAGECAVIFWWMHFGRSGSIFPVVNGGEAAVLFCFTVLYLVFAGPGAFSVDGLLEKKPA